MFIGAIEWECAGFSHFDSNVLERIEMNQRQECAGEKCTLFLWLKSKNRKQMNQEICFLQDENDFSEKELKTTRREHVDFILF